jgi:hypothetical protein
VLLAELPDIVTVELVEPRDVAAEIAPLPALASLALKPACHRLLDAIQRSSTNSSQFRRLKIGVVEGLVHATNGIYFIARL